MGFPVTMFPVLFAIPRTSGWIAQWEEMLLDPEQKIARPRQIYIGTEAAGLRAARSKTRANCGAGADDVGARRLRVSVRPCAARAAPRVGAIDA